MDQLIGIKKNILFQGPVFSLSGYGAHARDLVVGLIDAVQFNVSIIPVGWGGNSTADKLNPDIINKLMFGVNNRFNFKEMKNEFIWIQCGVPNEFRKLGNYSIGITAGLEATYISKEWVIGCNRMSMVIVPSEFMRDMFLRSGVSVPVYSLFEGVDLEVFNPEVKMEGFNEVLDKTITTRFNFLFTGQWLKVERGKDRKQVSTLVEVFKEVFKDNPEVGLILKTYSINNSTPDKQFTTQKLRKLIGRVDRPRVYLIHGELTEQELSQLYTHTSMKYFVSLTSGEGWNRGSAEAVACDLPVGITGWSGHMEYIKKDVSVLFDFMYKEIPQEIINLGYYEIGMKWAAVDIQDVKDKLKYMYENYEKMKAKAVIYGVEFREKYSLKDMQSKLISIIDQIQIPKTLSLLNMKEV